MISQNLTKKTLCSPFRTKNQTVLSEWIDYNGHMNVAYYVLIFDLYGAEFLMTKFEMGEHSAKTTKKSTMVVESHITYNQEVNIDHWRKRK